MNKFVVAFSLLLAVIFLISTPAQASNNSDKKIVHIKAGEIITTNIYTLADEVIVDGVINGDLITIAKQITINGQIEGDLLALATEITINSPINGNVRVASEQFVLNSNIGRNLNVLATTITLEKNSLILWDAYLMGSNVSIKGKINGALQSFAEKNKISGEIGQDANVKVLGNKKNQNNLNLLGAIINGDLNYQSNNLAEIDQTSVIAGQINPQITTLNKKSVMPTPSLLKLIYNILSALIFGFLLILIGKKHIVGIFENLTKGFKKLVKPAIILLLLPPLGIIVLFITIIGIPVSLTMLALWLILQYLARVIIMIFLGQWIIKFFNKEKPVHIVWSLVLGVVISYLLFSFPFVGWPLKILASLAGLGAIYLYVKNKS